MRNRALVITCMAAVLSAPGAVRSQQRGPSFYYYTFTLSSPAFPDGGEVPPRHSGAVANPVSPKLEWKDAPAGTVSFVLMMRDTDVAIDKTHDDIAHYIIINIPGSSRSLAEGLPVTPQLPDGTIQLKNFAGRPGYLGPGAPASDPHHHYAWELYALDIKLDLGPDASRVDVLKAINGHCLGKAVLVGRFHR